MIIIEGKACAPYMGMVKVGTKGQIVIPKEVRDMFDIKPGDSLVLLARSDKGIALERLSSLSWLADKALGNTDEEKNLAGKIKELEAEVNDSGNKNE